TVACGGSDRLHHAAAPDTGPAAGRTAAGRRVGQGQLDQPRAGPPAGGLRPPSAAMSPTALVCLPFAGAGASFYRPWSTQVDPDRLRIVPLQLPGRERRIDEDPHRNVRAAVHELAASLTGALAGAGRVALFGHSLGAVLAYELALRLLDTPGGGGPEVVRL